MADIVVVAGVDNTDTDNVLLNPATNVLTVTGTVGANNLLVDFTSDNGSHLLNANPSGQATVSGGIGNNPFTNLEFGLANNAPFTRAVFNINAGTDGAVLIHVGGINIVGGFFEDDFTVGANGQNFFTVTAINGQLIDSIDLTAINGATFEDLRQVRLGGTGIVAVPAPSGMLLLSSGVIGAAAVLRRRFRLAHSEVQRRLRSARHAPRRLRETVARPGRGFTASPSVAAPPEFVPVAATK